MEKNENVFYKKWWFWLIITLFIITTIAISILTNLTNKSGKEINKLNTEIQHIYDNAKVYNSSDNTTLIIELRNWKSENVEKQNEIIDRVKKKLNSGKLKEFTSINMIAYVDSNNKEDMLIKISYDLPEFTQNQEETRVYIDFEEYKKLNETLEKTMDGYTDLFNSIY